MAGTDRRYGCAPGLARRRVWAEADINLPTVPDESVANDPKQIFSLIGFRG